MKELIEVAEELYKQIDKAQVHLINARLQKDEEGKKSAISEMETAMCDVSRLLKCFIDRKDNIVDLSEVWHNIIEEPDGVNNIVINVDNDWCINVSSIVYKDRWNSTVSRFAAKRWAYIKDLLPKGGANEQFQDK